MKTMAKFILVSILLAALTLIAAAPTQVPGADKVVAGGTYTLEQGETLDGNLFVLGGIAILEQDSVVEGDVMVMGGTLQADGVIEGDVNVVGGLITLGDNSVVTGDVNAIAGHLVRDEGSKVEGNVNTDVASMLPLFLTGRIQVPNIEGAFPFVIPGDIRVPQVNVGFNPLWSGMWLLFRSFLWAVIAVLIVLFLPQHTQRTAQAAVLQPLGSGGVGCLTVLVGIPVLILLLITICGIPLSLVGALLLILAWAFGMIALGLETGERLGRMLKQDWAPAVSAGIGTFVLTLVVNGGAELVPCVGWIIPALVGVVALGAVLLTRFGSRAYAAYSPPLSPGSTTGIMPPASEVQAVSEESSATPSEIPSEGESESGPSESA